MDERTDGILPSPYSSRTSASVETVAPSAAAPPQHQRQATKRKREREGGREVERALYLADYARLPSCLDI